MRLCSLWVEIVIFSHRDDDPDIPTGSLPPLSYSVLIQLLREATGVVLGQIKVKEDEQATVFQQSLATGMDPTYLLTDPEFYLSTHLSRLFDCDATDPTVSTHCVQSLQSYQSGQSEANSANSQTGSKSSGRGAGYRFQRYKGEGQDEDSQFDSVNLLSLEAAEALCSRMRDGVPVEVRAPQISGAL